MASDESLTMVSSSMLDEDYEDTDDGLQYQTRNSSLSRLSVCTSSLLDENDDAEASNPSELGIFMSGLSLESFDGSDADGEVSDVDKGGGREHDGSSDSDKEPGFYSLPSTPPHRRRKLPKAEGSEAREKEGSKSNMRRERRGAREKRTSWMVKERGNQYKRNRAGEREGVMVRGGG
ncbi:PREDICTED: uncharacterized protein LOC109116831 [Tarenaya hassleriana]|uniref:uncharacterized protein LOC109116831 n=1 Tax=Tarenaya hassleriana TaxID=28532 RepID=UPI0008FD70C8|nr:PREDICTED: uncharacterized protein LOC109116831 [Tarenaya hassleriana]